MIKKINLNNKEIEYTERITKRSVAMRISVYHDGRVVVSAPRLASREMIKKFVAEKSEWILKKIGDFKSSGRTPSVKYTKADYIKHKERARILAESKVSEFNKIYNFKYNNISIKDQKSRWGSCSRKGNLNFNYKIALIPEKLADYIVVHEICHLGEFNHGNKFWNLVSRAIPDHVALKKELMKISLRFH